MVRQSLCARRLVSAYVRALRLWPFKTFKPFQSFKPFERSAWFDRLTMSGYFFRSSGFLDKLGTKGAVEGEAEGSKG